MKYFDAERFYHQIEFHEVTPGPFALTDLQELYLVIQH